MYEETTRSIRITVKPFFLDEQSSPENDHYVFAYQVKIENQGEVIVQLRNRYWKITDGFGHQQEVRGEGVVGEQPVINPGDSYEYTSGTPLGTSSGIMVGTYEMVTSGGESFDAAVPAFSFDSPYTPKQLH